MKRRELFLDLVIYMIITFVVLILLALCPSKNTSKRISDDKWLQTANHRNNTRASHKISHSSDITTSGKSNRSDVDEFIAAYYQAGNKGINLFNRKGVQDDFVVDEEFHFENERYLAQREKLINCIVGMFNKFGFAGVVIGLTGIFLIIWFGIATICEFIKYLILRFLGYVVSLFV